MSEGHRNQLTYLSVYLIKLHHLSPVNDLHWKTNMKHMMCYDLNKYLFSFPFPFLFLFFTDKARDHVITCTKSHEKDHDDIT